jgi:hypothetical protein
MGDGCIPASYYYRYVFVQSIDNANYFYYIQYILNNIVSSSTFNYYDTRVNLTLQTIGYSFFHYY